MKRPRHGMSPRREPIPASSRTPTILGTSVWSGYPNGVISFRETQWYLAKCLAGELVGLEEVDDHRWTVYFGPIALGVLDVRNAKAHGWRHFGLLVRNDGALSSRRRRRAR
jgi:hypothetical protein